MTEPNRHRACFLLMQRALIEPIAVELESEALAKAWRFTCYDIRRAFQLANPAAFSDLEFKLKGKTLTVERKNGRESASAEPAPEPRDDHERCD